MNIPKENLIPGKWYVVDMFSGPILGPFDRKEQAESERREINIDGDCFSAVYRPQTTE